MHWAECSLDYAFTLGVGCCAVTPVCAGNGIVDAPERQGVWAGQARIGTRGSVAGSA